MGWNQKNCWCTLVVCGVSWAAINLPVSWPMSRFMKICGDVEGDTSPGCFCNIPQQLCNRRELVRHLNVSPAYCCIVLWHQCDGGGLGQHFNASPVHFCHTMGMAWCRSRLERHLNSSQAHLQVLTYTNAILCVALIKPVISLGDPKFRRGEELPYPRKDSQFIYGSANRVRSPAIFSQRETSVVARSFAGQRPKAHNNIWCPQAQD